MQANITLNKHSQSGIGFIEILITITITVVGLVGLASMQLQSLRANQSTNQKAQAIWIVSDLANRIRANSQGDYSTTNYSCGAAVAIPVATSRCAPFYANSNLFNATTTCTAAQLVAFDLQDVLCGFPQDTTNRISYPNAASFLANPTLNIQRRSAGNVQISLTWTVRDNATNTGRTEDVTMVVYP